MDEELKETEEETKKEPVIEEIDETERLKQQVKQEQDKYLRSLADMENTRKRMQKEKQDTTRFAVENVIAEFLAPLDHFENALSFVHQASEETRNWAKGFEMILSQFKELLTRHKVTPFSSEGQIFDPHLHEVLELEETEKYEDGTIIQEFLKGYRCGERILRPAHVKVAKAPSKGEEKESEQQTSQGE
ncbi:MAG: nucleotide exchange factor GrpE [Chlamydiota bacterium]